MPENPEELVLKLGYLHVPDTDLGERVYQEVADTLLHTNVAPETYEKQFLGTEYSRFTLGTKWTVSAGWKYFTKYGNATGNRYGASSQSDADAQARKKVTRIKSGEGIQSFKDEYLKAYPELLLEHNDALDLPITSSYAHLYRCEVFECNNGRVPCSHCNGSGKREVHTTNSNGVYERRWENCVSCFGNKTMTCWECQGHGVKTYITTVWAKAEPTFYLKMPTSNWEKPIGKALKALSIKERSKLFDPKYAGYTDVSEDSIECTFNGVASMTSIELKSPAEQRYRIRALGNQLALFRPDPVLDEHMLPIMARLDNLSKMSRSQKLATFESLLDYPIFRRMFEVRSRFPSGEPQQQFLNICNALVSSAVADDIGPTITKVIEGVCPRFSFLPWLLLSIPSSLALLKIALEDIGLWATATILLGVGIMLVSSVTTIYRRRKIPKQYRTPVQEWKMLLVFAALSAAIAGYASSLSNSQKQALRTQIAEMLNFTSEPVLEAPFSSLIKKMNVDVVPLNFDNDYVFTITSNTNFRTGPSQDASVIDVIPQNATLSDLLGESGSWYLVRYDGQEGFVHKSLVEIFHP